MNLIKIKSWFEENMEMNAKNIHSKNPKLNNLFRETNDLSFNRAITIQYWILQRTESRIYAANKNSKLYTSAFAD